MNKAVAKQPERKAEDVAEYKEHLSAVQEGDEGSPEYALLV